MSINDDLNESQPCRCVKCGRKYPDTIVNIEGSIHHDCEMKCIDTKSCNRLARKIRKKARRLISESRNTQRRIKNV